MSEIAKTLEAKKRELRALKESRPKAYCAKGHSTEADVRREIEVEALEEEIRKLEKNYRQNLPTQKKTRL
ncbi:MAG: hypothetical protein JXA30_06505 [Deltaproteobacteria bacterium]|nr:hypothetical protein [Deltaproteobacteria bacterium]